MICLRVSLPIYTPSVPTGRVAQSNSLHTLVSEKHHCGASTTVIAQMLSHLSKDCEAPGWNLHVHDYL